MLCGVFKGVIWGRNDPHPAPELMKTLRHLRGEDITGLNQRGCFNMHQMTENDGYHKHLSDTKCRSAAELRDTSAALNTRGKLDTQHLEINDEGCNYNIFFFCWTKQTMAPTRNDSWVSIYKVWTQN